MVLITLLFDVRIVFAAIASVIAAYASWLVVQDVRVKKKYRLPPQVPGPPLIGNIFQMPKTDHGPYLQKLGRQYGEMFTLKFGSTYWVVLNSRRVAHELLEKRAAIYSSRQNLPMAHRIVSGEKRILLMPYGDAWRRQRKMMHKVLNSSQQGIYKPFQDLESKALMYQLLVQPETWYLWLGRFSNSVIMSVIFGRRTHPGDVNLSAVYSAQEEFVPYMMPGASIIDAFPILEKASFLKSFQPWRRKGDDLYRRTKKAFLKLIEELESRINAGTQRPCFMTELIASNDEEKFTREEIAFIAGTLIEAGTDTTRTSMLSLIAGTAMYPEWVERARKELDAVCGPNAERLPTFEDMNKLPMIKAAVKESVRWRPTNAQTGIPHALTEDDEFEGYRFPAGTVVTWNNWGISLDSNEYDEAERFSPDRFLDEDLDKVAKGHLGFGAGRRLCVGYNVAASNLLIVIARLVYCFDIEQDPSEPVKVDKPLPFSAEVEPYKVFIKPRSDAHRRLIMEECQTAAKIDEQ
ncbi:hypothetical protein Plec18167_004107 [Paecilomyces lecythidis]|uniref:Cytochrome P450 n=1 Tax=Paecilomyces lecythidis TaxID=3004212 RepID=A0ABR3XVF7_9EURO